MVYVRNYYVGPSYSWDLTFVLSIASYHTNLSLHTQLGDIMGEGEFGPVIMGVATNIIPGEERTLVAVKELVQRGEEGEDELNPELALVDFANQMKLEFGNIAMILGMCTDHEPYYVIYEYLDEVSHVIR